MNKTACLVIGFLCGGTSVGVPLYFGMRRWCDKRIAEEIGKYKVEAGLDRPRKKVKEGNSPSGMSSADVQYVQRSSLDGGEVAMEKVAYHKMAANYRKRESDLTSELTRGDGLENIDTSSGAEEPEGERYEFIDDEAFDEENGYDKTDLTWYPMDDVIIDNFNEIVENRDKIFGPLISEELRDSILAEPKGNSVIYIRNNFLKSDYAIDVEAYITYEEAYGE